MTNLALTASNPRDSGKLVDFGVHLVGLTVVVLDLLDDEVVVVAAGGGSNEVRKLMLSVDVKEVALSVALNGNSIAGKLEAVSREKKLSVVGRT